MKGMLSAFGTVSHWADFKRSKKKMVAIMTICIFFETFYKSFFLFNPTDRHINRSKSSNVPDYLHLEDKRY